MRLLEVPEYRPAVLAGLLTSIGSKTDSTVMHRFTGEENSRNANDILCQQRHVRNSLVTYANKLPTDATDGGSYNLQALVEDLIAEAKTNLRSNSKVIPVLQALNALLEMDVLKRLCDSDSGTRR